MQGSLPVVGKGRGKGRGRDRGPTMRADTSLEKVDMGEVSGGQGREHPRMSTIKFRC